jgi:hypothetical protein
VAGKAVIVATGLHPVNVGGKRFTCYVLSLYAERQATALHVMSDIPDGKRLY